VKNYCDMNGHVLSSLSILNITKIYPTTHKLIVYF
jgi:hypothetical protein